MTNCHLNILTLVYKDSCWKRDALLKHVFFLQRYQPENNYLYHDVHLPLPSYIKDVEFDAIIFDVTFLSLRFTEFTRKFIEDYSFLRFSNAVKIALPQDEYDCHLLLDNLLIDFNIDILYSVVDDHHEILYPKFYQKGMIRPGYTGYLDDITIMERSNTPSFENREFDVGYRARKLPPFFGKLGEVKWQIAENFLKASSPYALNCNISTDGNSTILGTKWLDFIGNCKFTLGSNSGSSLLDPYGEIRKNVLKHIETNPTVKFEEVEKIFFPGLDGRWEFTGISPRIFEAALMRSAQILVEGSYSGLIKPWKNYIPIKSDCSNIQEVVKAMNDVSLVKQMIKNTDETLMYNPQLRYSHHAKTITDTILQLGGEKKHRSLSSNKMKKIIQQYHLEMRPQYDRLWKMQAFKENINEFAPPVYRFLKTMKQFKKKLLP